MGAPGGPATQRAKVVPRPESSIRSPGGSGERGSSWVAAMTTNVWHSPACVGHPALPGRRATVRAVRITAKVDYAVRAALELAARAPADGAGVLVKCDALASSQQIPVRFLEGILAELRRAGIVNSQRGSDGGYRLARPAASVTVADVIRAVEGPLADVHGEAPEALVYEGPATDLTAVWVATRVALREVLEATTLAAIASGPLPAGVTGRASDPDGWVRR